MCYLKYFSPSYVLNEQSIHALRVIVWSVSEKSICIVCGYQMARWLRALERKGKSCTIGPSKRMVPSVTRSLDSSGYNYVVTRLSEDCYGRGISQEEENTQWAQSVSHPNDKSGRRNYRGLWDWSHDGIVDVKGLLQLKLSLDE